MIKEKIWFYIKIIRILDLNLEQIKNLGLVNKYFNKASYEKIIIINADRTVEEIFNEIVTHFENQINSNNKQHKTKYQSMDEVPENLISECKNFINININKPEKISIFEIFLLQKFSQLKIFAKKVNFN